MRTASALSTSTIPSEIASEISSQLALSKPGILLVFVSWALVGSFESIVTHLRRALKPAHLLAVVGESIIGNNLEVESSPAVSALAIDAPDAGIHSFHIDEDQWRDVLTNDEILSLHVSPRPADNPHPSAIRAFIFFADPFTTPIVQLLDACSRQFPTAPIIGGMACGMRQEGETRIALNGEIFSTGLVGISLTGDIEVDTLVSQGCRAVGETFVITKGQHNVIEQLDGKPALAAIEEMVNGLPLLDRQLLTTGGLQIGRVIDQGKGSYGKGDFLIRSMVGLRRETGAVLVGDMIHTGQTLQFHVRDAQAADEEMRLLLEGESMLAAEPPAGVLLITCHGRGTHLFEKPHHDVELTRSILGNVPIAGFFAAGELGPVGNRNFVHGHSAALAMFRPARQPE